MKHTKTILCALLCVSVCAAALCGCGDTTGSGLLGKPENTTALSYDERGGAGLASMQTSAEAFAARFTQSALGGADTSANYAVSPVSVYMALSLAAACANGETREEIVSALGVSYELLEAEFSNYFRSITAEYTTYHNELMGLIKLGNSVWLDTETRFKQPCIDLLAQNYHCYSYAADFKFDNQGANNAVRNFVKEQTRGLIDQDFQLNTDTVFALINTLYLKDIWNYDRDLSFTEPMTFTNADGSTTQKALLCGNYSNGRVYETERYSSFFATTACGNKLKFIVPKDGYSLNQVFNAESIAEVNAVKDYGGFVKGEETTDEFGFPVNNNIEYYTRCIFPAFSAKYDEDVIPLLKNDFGINAMFNSPKADFSGITNRAVYCEKVQHVAKLEVNERGIEGAAVTVIGFDATSVPPNQKVYEQFTVDRAFGFILTDSYNNTLFTGVVNQI